MFYTNKAYFKIKWNTLLDYHKTKNWNPYFHILFDDLNDICKDNCGIANEELTKVEEFDLLNILYNSQINTVFNLKSIQSSAITGIAILLSALATFADR